MPHDKAWWREYQKKRRARLASEGKCIRCMGPNEEGVGLLCEDCSAIAAEDMVIRREANGLTRVDISR